MEVDTLFSPMVHIEGPMKYRSYPIVYDTGMYDSCFNVTNFGVPYTTG